MRRQCSFLETVGTGRGRSRVPGELGSARGHPRNDSVRRTDVHQRARTLPGLLASSLCPHWDRRQSRFRETNYFI